MLSYGGKCIDTDTELDSHKMFSDAIDAIESIYQNKLFLRKSLKTSLKIAPVR